MDGDSLDPVGTGTMSAVEMLVAAANYDIVNKFREFVTTPANWSGDDGIPQRLLEHIEYTVLAVGIAALIALPVGMLIGHTGRGAFLAINMGNAARAIPTLGLLVLVAGLAVLVDVLFSLLIRTVVSPGVTGRAATRTRKDETEPVVAASSA